MYTYFNNINNNTANNIIINSRHGSIRLGHVLVQGGLVAFSISPVMARGLRNHIDQLILCNLSLSLSLSIYLYVSLSLYIYIYM